VAEVEEDRVPWKKSEDVGGRFKAGVTISVESLRYAELLAESMDA
jgi:hypothetical protein